MQIDDKVLREPHELGSYAIKLIHPTITDELRRRATSGNSVETIFPFVRLTSAIELPSTVATDTEGRLVTPGQYFSIGLHSTQTPTTDGGILTNGRLSNYNNPFDSVYNIFNPTNADIGPVIGTIRQQINGVVTNAYVRAKTDPSSPGQVPELATDYLYAPPPGVVSAKIDRNNNGQVNSALIEVVIPTLAQFEALAEIFFVPGVTMIFEWGSLSSSVTDNLAMLPWNNLQEIEGILKKNNWYGPTALEIFNEYTYPSKGRYSFIVGKLASFEATMSNTGEFIVKLKLIGPGEQNFAYTVYDTVTSVLALADEDVSSIAAGAISTYFAENGRFDNLINDIDRLSPDKWAKHVYKPRRDETLDEAPPDASPTEDENGQVEERIATQNLPTFLEAFDNKNAVFVTWKFFVNVILNDERYGIKSLFVNSGMTPEQVASIKFLNPLKDDDGPDPDEPYVGCHRYLRSVDASVCVIYNEIAQSAVQDPQGPWKSYINPEHIENEATIVKEEFGKFGSFGGGEDAADRGFLSTGVWLNANAIRESILSGMTLHEGIANLLNRMSAATRSYWELSLDFDDQEVTYDTQGTSQPKGIKNFLVVDRKYRGTLERLKNGNIYKFNKYFNPASGVGSELIDFTVGLNTPPLLMTQLAFSIPISEANPRGLQLGGFNGSMQNLFEPPIENGLSLMKIDIVRKRAMTNQSSAVSGRPPAGAANPNANSTAENNVVSQQETATLRNAVIDPIQQYAESQTFVQNERNEERSRLAKEDLERRIKEETDPEKVVALRESITALERQQKTFETRNTPGKNLQLASNKYPHLRPTFSLIEWVPELMLNKMSKEPSSTDDKNKYQVNNNLKYSLNPLEANLTLPGICGIRVGELVRLGRMPKRLFENRGAWQILGLTDNISSDDGWTTNIRCRFMPLPYTIVQQLRDI